jgi:hypothetical protein
MKRRCFQTVQQALYESLFLFAAGAAFLMFFRAAARCFRVATKVVDEVFYSILSTNELLFFSGSFLQKLQGIFLGLFSCLACCLGCFLEGFVGDVLGVSHIVIGHLAAAVIAHKGLLSCLCQSSQQQGLR